MCTNNSEHISNITLHLSLMYMNIKYIDIIFLSFLCTYFLGNLYESKVCMRTILQENCYQTRIDSHLLNIKKINFNFLLISLTKTIPWYYLFDI